jgi:hypothetical protein
MNLLRAYSTNSKYLLPLVMLAAVFFIFQGISVPNLPNLQEPKLSSPQKAKPSTSAVIKTLLQSSQFKVTKTTQYLDLFSNYHHFKNPAAHLSFLRNDPNSFSFSAVPTFPARDPPA